MSATTKQPDRLIAFGDCDEPDDDEYYDDEIDETDDDERNADADLEDALNDCGMMHDGQCSKAGSEECDWECPFS